MVGFIFNGRYFWRFMCLSQQDILLLAILHGAPVLTAHSQCSDQESHIHRQPSESQITGTNGHSSEPPSCAGQHYGVIIAVNVWSSR